MRCLQGERLDRMTFTHLNKINLPKLETKMIEHKRYYVTPENIYCPSVTTVLADYDNEGLIKWREEVGEKMADYISFQATSSGSEFHKIIADYLSNRLDLSEYKKLLPKAHFHNVKHLLDKINNIYGLDTHLHSNILRLAGSADCIAEFDGVLSIIDFKTAKREKKEEHLRKYFLQETAYSIMARECANTQANQIVTIISGEDGWSDAIIKHEADYEEELVQIVEDYHTANEIIIND